MINVKNTIYKNINYRINRLRKLADNNPSVMKKILYLTILDDLFDWADFKEDSQEIQRKLQDCRLKFILNNHDIFPEYDCSQNCTYVNVNIPRANSQWKRIWDSKETCIDLDLTKKPCIVIDPNYKPKVILLPYIKDGKGVLWIGEDKLLHYNEQLITNHDKMNFYIDDQENIWKFDPDDCEWKIISNKSQLTDDQLQCVIDELTNKLGKINIEEIGTDDKKLQFTLGTSENNIIDIMDKSDLEDIYDD